MTLHYWAEERENGAAILFAREPRTKTFQNKRNLLVLRDQKLRKLIWALQNKEILHYTIASSFDKS